MDYAERLLQMKQMRDEGTTSQEIGKRFGISAQRVGQILTDKAKYAPRLKEPKHQPAPNITVYEVLKIAEKIKKETGRYPSYGRLVADIESGRVNPSQYIRLKRRVV